MADQTIEMIHAFRCVWVEGRFGGGKTSLSLELARQLVERNKVKYITGNIKSVWKDKLEDIIPEGIQLNTACVLDEGGLFIKNTRQAEQYLAALRRLNVVLLIPSVLPVASRMRMIRIQRVFRMQSVGIPLWVYKTILTYGNQHDEQYFFWWRPEEIFGTYDTYYFPVDDEGISDWLEGALEKATDGRSRKQFRSIDNTNEISAMEEIIEEGVTEIQCAIETLQKQRNKKRRR